jgi:hypothetical protein
MKNNPLAGISIAYSAINKESRKACETAELAGHETAWV